MSAPVRVESSEDVLRKLLRISAGKYLTVNFYEMLLGQFTVGTVFKKSFVPFLQKVQKFYIKAL